jgi:hypothetical protein
MAFDLDTATWGAPLPVPTQGTLSFTPAVAACGDGRVDVVYAGGRQHPFHRVLQITSSTALALAEETAIGGTISASLALTCSGYRRLELIGRGTDNLPYHNHFVGPADFTGLHDGSQISPGWQGWDQLTGAFYGTAFSGQVSAFAALASTRTGDVSLLTLQGGGSQPLLWNSYDSNRFGVAPWKAVEWRGFQQVGSVNAVGAPALAVSDRQLEVGLALRSGELRLARLSPTGLPQMEPLISSPGAPMPVSSGPGTLDIITPDINSGLDDFRLRNSESSTAFTTRSDPSWAPHIVSLAAVSSATGVIDVVGVADNNSLYHWRSLFGQWQQPVYVPFDVPSTPTSGLIGPGPIPQPSAPAPSVASSMPFIFGFQRPPSRPPTDHRRPVPIHQPPQPAIVPGAASSAPVLVATGAGQLELFAIGSRTYRGTPLGDGTLYHWRFTNGAWTPAEQVHWDRKASAAYFGQPAASSWGDGVVDLAVIEDDNGAVFHTRFLAAPVPSDRLVIGGAQSPPTPVFTQIGGIARDVPVLASLGPQRLGMLEIGTDGYAYENWAVPTAPAGGRFARAWTLEQIALGLNLSWTGFSPLTSTPVTVGGVARVGDSELAATATDQSGVTYVNRFAGSRWTGFVAIPRSSSGTAPAQSFKAPLIVH